jgi:hypothetical protein
MKESDIDLAYLFAEDDARQGRFGELVAKLRSQVPLTRGERDLLADMLEGKWTRPAHRIPNAPDYDLQEAVARTVAALIKAGEKAEYAYRVAAQHHCLSVAKVRRLIAAEKMAARKLRADYKRIVAKILKDANRAQ